MTRALAEAAAGDVVAAYPLTGLQTGMLFHHLLAARAGVDVVQVVCSLAQPLDEAAFVRAWAGVTCRHDALRTALRWLGRPQPVAEVHAAVEVPFRSEDLRALAPDARAARLRDYLRADRDAGFPLDAAPLFRLALFRTGEAAYEFVWTMHHAALDGRSYLIVLRDVAAAYEAASGRRPPPPHAAAQFGEFIAWLERRDPFAGEAFWRARLRGRAAPTPLPAGFANGRAAAGAEASADACSLSGETTAALGRLASASGCTPTTVVQAAWALLLARHSGEGDVVFGVTRACRRATIAGADDVVGAFVNTLPLRIEVAAEAALGDWLTSVRDAWQALRDVEHTPLARVQEWSDTPAGTPLFDTLVVYESGTLEAALAPVGGPFARARVELIGQTNHALTLEAFGGERLRLKLEYDPGRYRGADVARILGRLRTILEGMAAVGAAGRVRDVPWLTPGERRLVLEDWNRTTTAYPRDASVPDVFARRVAATPDAVAVVHRAREVTYRELDERSSGVALRLHELGVARGTRVGLLLERSVDMVAGMLGILKAGAAYVPFDPAHPAARLDVIARATALAAVLTQRSLAGRVPPGVGNVVVLDAPDGVDGDPTTHSGCAAVAADPAYVLYTSGSTGSPKGVVATHRGIVRLVAGATYARFGADETVLSFAPPTFDAATFETWAPLLNGGRLVLFPASEPTLEGLAGAIREHAVTTLWLTAALFHQMVDRHLDGLRPLRQLLAGGDVLSPAHVRRFRHEVPDCRLVNGYGPTENTTFSACYTVPAGWDLRAGSVPIGKPVSNSTVYVLDASLAPVPPGVSGRLYTGGDGVALGYHGRPDLSAQRFFPDPFSREPGARMYDTGDRARWLPDGTLEFQGRFDDQVKIRGFRVEPGEVEAALAAHPAVGGALAVARTDAAGTRRLVAYAVPAPGREPEPEVLRRFLADRLPAYLVPASVVVLATFPVTANGKLDRSALPEPDAEVAERRAPFVAPRTTVEAALAAVWAEILGLERVSVCDDFFELGGDSLLTISLVSRARDAGFHVTPRQLYDAPTVAGLATLATPSACREEPEALPGPVPATPVQRWFFEGEDRAWNYWNQTFLFTLAPGVDEAALRAALAALLAHHDALRARFRRGPSGWEQTLDAASAHVPFERVALAALAPEERVRAIEDAGVRVQASLDIERGPLLRAALLDLGPDLPARLLIAIHHLAVDGVSWRLLLEDLERAYVAIVRGGPPWFPAKTSSYGRWAQRLAAMAAESPFVDGRSHWHALAAGGRTTLPVDRALPGPQKEGDARTLCVTLSSAATDELLHRVPAAAKARVEEVLVAALGLALRGWAGGEDVLIDLEGHGREDVFDDLDLSRTVGWCTSVFPFALDLAPQTPAAALRTAKERLRAVPLRGLGYGVLRYLADDPVLAAAPQPDLVFNYLGRFDAVLAGSQLLAFASESPGPWRAPSARRRYALEVNALVMDGRLNVRWSYGPGHDAATVDRLAAAYLEALEAVLAHCRSTAIQTWTPSDFPLVALDVATLERLVREVPNLDDVYPLAPIQQLFAAFADPATDPGFEQWRYRLRGPVDPARLRAAWQGVLERHPILRTGFELASDAEPLQVVRRNVALPWTDYDWRHLSAGERAGRLNALLHDDRQRGFDRRVPPLMRLTLVRLRDEDYELVWSLHHLLLDRWSWPLVLQDVGRLYSAPGEAEPATPAPATPYRDYVAWLANQDLVAAERFWRATFAGFAAPPPFARRSPEDAAVTPLAGAFSLDRDETAALQGVARAARVAPNVAVLGAWALCIAHRFDTADLAVGVALSGRPADLPRIDGLVGVTINDLPVRVRLDPAETVTAYLQRLAATQADVQAYAFTPPDRVQAWSDVPWRRRLFETLVVFQDGAAEAKTQAWLGRDIAIEVEPAPTRTQYPLSLVVSGTERLVLRLCYDPRYGDRTELAATVRDVRTVLSGLVYEPAATVGRLLASLAPEGRGAASQVEMRLAARPYVAPRSALEAAIAGLWGELLDVPLVGADDDFFELGGQSLLAMHAVAQLRDTFGVALPVRDLFAHPTVAGTAAALERLEPHPGYLGRVAELVRQVEAMSLEELRTAGTRADA